MMPLCLRGGQVQLKDVRQKPQESFFYKMQTAHSSISLDWVGRMRHWLTLPMWLWWLAGCPNLGTFLDIYQVKRWDQGNHNFKPRILWNWNSKHFAWQWFLFWSSYLIEPRGSWHPCCEVVYFFQWEKLHLPVPNWYGHLTDFYLSMNVRIPALQLEALPLSKPLLVGRQHAEEKTHSEI